MSDTATADTATTTDTPTQDTAPDTDTTDWKAEAEKYQALQRKWEDRAKTNANAQKELDELRKASMTDLEKAVDEARAAGRAEAISEVGAKVVAAEFRAAAAGRLDSDALVTLIEGLNLMAFVDQDGDVDPARVAAFVDGIVPPANEQETPNYMPVDLGQGARTDPKNMALNGDPLLAAVEDRLGITRRKR